MLRSGKLATWERSKHGKITTGSVAGPSADSTRFQIVFLVYSHPATQHLPFKSSQTVHLQNSLVFTVTIAVRGWFKFTSVKYNLMLYKCIYLFLNVRYIIITETASNSNKTKFSEEIVQNFGKTAHSLPCLIYCMSVKYEDTARRSLAQLSGNNKKSADSRKKKKKKIFFSFKP